MKASRKLNFSDVFRMAHIINTVGITSDDIAELMSISENISEESVQETAGMKLFDFVMTKCPNAENILYKFLAGVAGKTPEEIANADFTDIIELVGDIFETNKDIPDFFTRAIRAAKAIPST